MTAPQIRALAICLFRHNGRILVNEAHDPAKGLRFCRPLGGGIEFGETGAEAVARETFEEIGAEVTNVRYIGTLENIFTYLGEPCHEIVRVYDGELVDRSLYERAFLPGIESDGQPCLSAPSYDWFPTDSSISCLRAKQGSVFNMRHASS